MTIQLAILASGRGSNLQAILQAIGNRDLDAKVQVVISNVPGTRALAIAKSHQVTAVEILHRGLSHHEHEILVMRELRNYCIDYVVLAGYMRILTSQFLKSYPNVINIHPSLLPAFPGANAYEDAFNADVITSGITVHFVDEQVDHGPILAQEEFPRLPDDTIEAFKSRGLAVEHRLYPRVLQSLAKKGPVKL